MGEISITTTLVTSFLVSVPLARRNTYFIDPGHSQIWLNLLTVVLVHGAGIFIFSVMFQLASNTDAPSLSPTGHVALATTASLNAVALPLEEPL